MAAAYTKLKKHQTIPFINIAPSTMGLGRSAEQWVRIGKSTIFDLALNPNIVTNDYIEDEMPTDEITYYKPSLPQELQTIKGDPAFDFMYEMLYDLPTGEDVKKDFLLVFAGTAGPEQPTQFKAWKCKASVQLTNFNTVDEKILFTISIIDIERGTATVSGGTPTFSSGEAA